MSATRQANSKKESIMKNFILTMKDGEAVLKQLKLTEQVAFDTIRKTFLMAGRTSDSADIQTLAVFNELASGKAAKAIEYNGKRLIIQKAE
jgi:hypothetical protein